MKKEHVYSYTFYDENEESFLKKELHEKWGYSFNRINYKILKLNKETLPKNIKDYVLLLHHKLCDFNNQEGIAYMLNNDRNIMCNITLHKIYYYADIDVNKKHLYMYEIIEDEELFNKIYMISYL